MERVKPQSALCVGSQPWSQQPQPVIRPPYLHTLSDAMLLGFNANYKNFAYPPSKYMQKESQFKEM